MPDESANCIVTSPPYWGKRDYGVAGQYGHEDSPAAYVDTMRDVFHEARRVLADDGTCWLNLGDSYSASGGGATGMHAYLGEHITTHRATGLHAKNLLGLPWRVAFALQEDGWILRNAVIWHKPNAMPESVRDRLSCRHELLFLLAKSPAYWFDLDPIRVPHKTVKHTAAGRSPRAYPPAGPPGSRTRPPKYGPGTPEVTTARRYGDRRHSPAGTRTGATPATCGRSPPAPTAGRTSPPTRSTSRCGASPPDASQAAWCLTRSPAAAPPASRRSSWVAGSPGIDLSPDFARLAAGRLAQAVANRTEGTA